MPTRQQIKENAKLQLDKNIFSNKWMTALLIALIYSIVVSIIGSIPAIGAVALFVLGGPISVGLYTVFIHISRNQEKIDFNDLLAGFREGLENRILTGLLMYVFTMLWSLLFFIPGIIKSYSYAMAPYLSADNANATWQENMNRSKAMMHGHKWELFVLDLSFIGWYILGSMCFGVGTLWVVPYHETARANYYNALNAATSNAQYA